MENKIYYKGLLCTVVQNAGRVWREPESGYKSAIDENGIEYDITDYIEEEALNLLDEFGKTYFVYRSDCVELQPKV